jgi:hypothetical protein
MKSLNLKKKSNYKKKQRKKNKNKTCQMVSELDVVGGL